MLTVYVLVLAACLLDAVSAGRGGGGGLYGKNKMILCEVTDINGDVVSTNPCFLDTRCVTETKVKGKCYNQDRLYFSYCDRKPIPGFKEACYIRDIQTDEVLVDRSITCTCNRNGIEISHSNGKKYSMTYCSDDRYYEPYRDDRYYFLNQDLSYCVEYQWVDPVTATPLANNACNEPAWCSNMAKRLCYYAEEQTRCCQTCPIYRSQARYSNCPYGDKYTWCRTDYCTNRVTNQDCCETCANISPNP